MRVWGGGSGPGGHGGRTACGAPVGYSQRLIGVFPGVFSMWRLGSRHACERERADDTVLPNVQSGGSVWQSGNARLAELTGWSTESGGDRGGASRKEDDAGRGFRKGGQRIQQQGQTRRHTGQIPARPERREKNRVHTIK